MKKIPYILFVLALCIGINSCKKKDNNPTPYSIRMTDAPGPYSQVNIDLQAVEVTGNNGGVVQLNVHQGVYNLLDFSNGIDTLIATGGLTFSSVEQIRLILGTNNTVVVGGTSYPLSTPSAQQSGLKLQVHQALQAGVAYAVLLDFDANQSIVQEGNGAYQLKPVIRTVEVAVSGAIKGTITPLGTSATVTAALNGSSYSSQVNAMGDFTISGLPPGTYTLTVTPATPLTPVTITGIVVTTGLTTDAGVINL